MSTGFLLYGNTNGNPVFTPNGLFMRWGDSRTANTGAYNTSSNLLSGLGYGLYHSFIDNKLLPGNTGTYGVGGSTTHSGYYRIKDNSNAQTGNPASTDTGTPQDVAFNSGASGEYQPRYDPANVVIYLYSVNDGQTGYWQSPVATMNDVSYQLDTFIAAGKFVFLCNETPIRWSYRQGELQSVTSNTCQAKNTTSFTNKCLFNTDTGELYTQVSIITANKQYTVSSSGLYTFNSGDPITRAQISYYWAQRDPTVSGKRKQILHNWFISSDANYKDPYGTSWDVPGALYNRQSMVEIVDSWGALVNPATSDINTENLQGTLTDGLHPNTKSNILLGQAFATSFNRRFPNAKTMFTRPTGNNFYLATTFGTSIRFPSSGTITLPVTGFATSSNNSLTPGTTKILVGGVASPFDVSNNDGTGTITGANYTATLNYANRSVFILFSSTPAAGQYIEICSDVAVNLIENGLLDYDHGNGTVTQSTTGGLVTGVPPKNWTMTLDSTVQAAVTANTFNIGITNGTHPDTGLPEMIVTYQGTLGGTSGNPSLITISATAKHSAARINQGSPGDKIRASVVTRTMFGPDGHITGTSIPQIRAFVQSSVSVTRALPSTATTNNQTGSVTIQQQTYGGGINNTAGGSDSIDFGLSDEDIPSASGFKLPLCTCPIDCSGTSLTNVILYLQIPIAQNKYISGQVAFSQASIQVASI